MAYNVTRRIGESITIVCPDGRKIVITYKGPRKGRGARRVSIGIDAPLDYRIKRDEEGS